MSAVAAFTNEQVSKDVTSDKPLLVVEDDPSLREALCDTLELSGYCVLQAASAEQAILVLQARANDIGLIISDVNMGNLSGHDLLRQVQADYAHIPMILMTAYASIEASVKAMRQGASDYLVKPFEPDMLIQTVQQHLPGAVTMGKEPIVESHASLQLLSLARRVAQTDSTVMILGESGTGKEVLAHYIHDHSKRADQPFIAINCAAIPENMLEAMLFGHEKGAYTGAHSSAPGKFEQANGGTLLLDEISEMDLGLQAKLLRVLQEREVERLGGRKSISLDVRVIATSNRDMREYVTAGQFREDLYFRLSVLPLAWLPLRDRTEDILPLAEKLLAGHARKQRRGRVKLASDARKALQNYLWPGNVRELDNVMQRALILQPGRCINAQDLGLEIVFQQSEKPSLLGVNSVAASAPKVISSESDAQTKDQHRQQADQNAEVKVANQDEGLSPALGSDLKKHEFEIILQTYREVGGSKKLTAEKLGISPRTLRYKLSRLKELGYAL